MTKKLAAVAAGVAACLSTAELTVGTITWAAGFRRVTKHRGWRLRQ